MAKVLCLVLFCFVLSAVGFPDGAPVDACVKPRHNQPNHSKAKSQPPETSPYQILQSALEYAPGTQITVVIQAAEPFKGFFLQARDVASDGWIGQWVESSNTKAYPECSAITHADPELKTQAVLTWQAPHNVAPGQVYFTGTVLQKYTKYWSNLVSLVAQ